MKGLAGNNLGVTPSRRRTTPTAGQRSDTEFLRRRNNRLLQKQKKLKTIKLKGIHLLFILTVLTFLAFSIYKAGQFLMNWEKLNIESFQLVNSPRERLPQLQDILRRFSGNILVLDVEELRTQLGRIPEVKDVSVSRNLPSTVEITFLLREPALQVAMEDKYHIIDREGVDMYSLDTAQDNLVTVLDQKGKYWKEILPFLPQLDTVGEALEYVTWKKPYGVVLKLKGLNETFYPGDIDFNKKINYYLRLRKRFSLDKENIKNVDLRFQDRFYLEYQEEVVR